MEWFRGGRGTLVLASLFVCATAAQASNPDAAVEDLGMLNQARMSNMIAVPEPGAMLLVGTGLLLAARRLRKNS